MSSTQFHDLVMDSHVLRDGLARCKQHHQKYGFFSARLSPELEQTCQHSYRLQEQELNYHLYPVLATFSVIYFAIQVAPMAQQARLFNRCVDGIEAHLKASNIPLEYRLGNVAIPERICHGGFDH